MTGLHQQLNGKMVRAQFSAPYYLPLERYEWEYALSATIKQKEADSTLNHLNRLRWDLERP
jgi:hypothetical protein